MSLGWCCFLGVEAGEDGNLQLVSAGSGGCLLRRALFLACCFPWAEVEGPSGIRTVISFQGSLYPVVLDEISSFFCFI